MAALTLTACTSAETGSGVDQPEGSQQTAAGPTVAGRWPFTGRRATGPAPRRPPVVVKVDNTDPAAPQVGLRRADLVVEELVEGGYTRLAAVFYSRLPRVVGPVRSMRATDIGIVGPTAGRLVASGGAPPTVRRLHAAGIKTSLEDAPGFFRQSGRTAPYDLMVRLPALVRGLDAPKHRPGHYLPWGGDDLPRGSRATAFDVSFGDRTTRWRFRDGSYRNLSSHAARDAQFRPVTVLVLGCRVGDAGYLDPSGAQVPETDLTGTGPAAVFHDGRRVTGTWRKPRLDAPLELRTGSGRLTLPPGRTWIELVPRGRGGVTTR